MPASAATRARLQQFVDDEMLRAPLLAEQVFDAAFEDLRRGAPGASQQERFAAADMLRVAEAARASMVQAFVKSVGDQVRAELDGAAQTAGARLRDAAPKLELSLVDDEAVAVDVELSHLIQAVKSVAEHELRELATYTAALAGDMDMGRDHNPFRAETYARAMWQAAQVLPATRGHQVRLMRAASRPLALVLRQSYAGSCARLESAGVEPATYRTMILAQGARTARPGDSWLGQGPNLAQMRDTMPAPLQEEGVRPSSNVPLDRVLQDADEALRRLPAHAGATERAQLTSSQRSRIVRHADKVVDQQLIELLSRLFDYILADRRLPRDLQFTLTRTQAAVMRLALRDPKVLDSYDHPVWRFMDHIAHQTSLEPEGSPARAELLRLAEGLIDTLSGDETPTAARYEWARERLKAAARGRLERRLSRMAPDIAMLQALEERLADRNEPLATGVGPLDETQLETVPAELMDELQAPAADAPATTAWLDGLRPGHWLRMFRDGHWVRGQLLWQGRQRDVWLFGNPQDDRTWALRRSAMARLYREGLASTLRPRSLVKAAAVALMRSGQGGAEPAPAPAPGTQRT